MAEAKYEEQAFTIEGGDQLKESKLNGLIAQGWRTVSTIGNTVIMRRPVKTESVSGGKRRLLD